MSRLVADHPPLCFMRRQDRAGLPKGAEEIDFG
jgi:hypothetical protein